MEKNLDLQQYLEDINPENNPYNREAYNFAYEVVTESFLFELQNRGSGHISAEEFLERARELAISSFGCLATMVFDEWGIKNSRDIGNIVYNLMEKGILTKHSDDRVEEFYTGYNNLPISKAFKVHPVLKSEGNELEVSYELVKE